MIMTTLYHGTTKENSEKILQEGFRIGTYFTPYFDSAVSMGGAYVFGVLFHEDVVPKNDEWQFRFPEHILPNRILHLTKVSFELLKYNPEAGMALRKSHMVSPCPTCNGQGEVGRPPDTGQWILPGGSAFDWSREVKVCPQCRGHGDLDLLVKALGAEGGGCVRADD